MKKLLIIIALTLLMGFVGLSFVGIPAPKTSLTKEIPLENIEGTGN